MSVWTIAIALPILLNLGDHLLPVFAVSNDSRYVTIVKGSCYGLVCCPVLLNANRIKVLGLLLHLRKGT